MLNGSFFLSEEIENGKTADAYWREELLTDERERGNAAAQAVLTRNRRVVSLPAPAKRLS